jgi:hypothetical protein
MISLSLLAAHPWIPDSGFGFLLAADPTHRDSPPSHPQTPLPFHTTRQQDSAPAGWDQPVPPKGDHMKIQPNRCCSNAYTTPVQRLSIVLLLAGAVVLVGGTMATRREPASATPVINDSIVVEAESPRAVVSKLAGTYSVQASDMRDEISLLVTNRDGVAIPLDRLDVQASYAPRDLEQRSIALKPMNKDHLMAAVDPSRDGTLIVKLAIDGARHELTFELPFTSVRRSQWDS